MNVLLCLVIGGGYAGINAVKAIRREWKDKSQTLRLILIDKKAYHVRKMLLFKPTAERKSIIKK
ncbi:hypothetical protein RRU94_17770 [Domibacillus sp. DTU_2020_1001157_1_SI_ALB_TIR_016]|uniref:hypothetical protein n=1 Tax=Domibacillus sp. DTU_2020_1001157_1_SI_ALB_TIR_016 TaxID=3077789 RepID=UPI0028EEC7DA|nr:hypothetical protein [Domibacillus sp. DTU_2020_1001157_1_SI_ALB_TIR_016]WNS79386.1 hypothetical protein RRU94_17770 [Domibacillus sp. DTU_2020_1001157_1_SI_ALB_TIR_016]